MLDPVWFRNFIALTKQRFPSAIKVILPKDMDDMVAQSFLKGELKDCVTVGQRGKKVVTLIDGMEAMFTTHLPPGILLVLLQGGLSVPKKETNNEH